MTPLVLNQNMDANDEEKNTPSTMAKAMRRLEKVDESSSIHLMVQLAFALMAGISLIALNRNIRSCVSWTKEDKSREYVSEWIFSLVVRQPHKPRNVLTRYLHHYLKPVEASRLSDLNLWREALH